MSAWVTAQKPRLFRGNGVSLESDIAQIESLFQGRDGIAQREKLLAEIASVPGFQKSAHNGRIIDFLGFVNLMTSGIARSMIVCEIRMILTNRADKITFHNLHMIDVIEQLHTRRVHQA